MTTTRRERRSSRATRVRIAIVGLMLVALAALPTVAGAFTGSCTPTRGHDNVARHVSTVGGVTGITGVAANILELDPYYSGSNHAGTNSTILLTNGPITKWAQLGWYKAKIQDPNNASRQSALEFYLSSTQNFFSFFGPKPVQTQTEYEILEDNTYFDFFVGGTYVSEWYGFTPLGYQMFSETHDFTDQMPGTSSNVETFRQSRYYTGVDHSGYHTITGAITSEGGTAYGYQNQGSGTYYVWDTCHSSASVPADPTLNIESIAQTTDPPPWSSPSAVLLSDDLSFYGIESATDVTGIALSAIQSSEWSLTEAAALKAAAGEIFVTPESRAYLARVSRTPGASKEPVWIITTPGGTLPFDGPVGGPVVGAPRLTGVILDAKTGEFWRGFVH